MNTKSKIFSVIIEKNDTLNNIVIEKEDIKKYVLDIDFIDYACFILHNKDVNENGEPKHEHYHLILRCVNNYAKETILNDICKHLVKNRATVSIKAMHSFDESVAYLTHKGMGEKYEYSFEELYSTDLELTRSIYDNPINENNLTVETIKDVCKKCSSIVEVYTILGLKNSKNYRNVIKDIWELFQRRF